MAYNEHYVKNCATVQIIDVIDCCPFILGSLLKYMVRYGSKDDEQQELYKINDYLNRSLSKKDDVEMFSWWNLNKRFVALFRDVFESHGFEGLDYENTLHHFLSSIRVALQAFPKDQSLR